MKNQNNPYAMFSDQELILRDQLAIDRTVLANERTFLAYIRTGLAFALTGVGIIRFFDVLWGVIVGSCLIALGLLIALVGVWRQRAVSRRLPTHYWRQVAVRQPAALEDCSVC